MNPLDVMIQQTGMIVPEDAYPIVLGNDVAGEVIAVGTSVSKVKSGDRVLACAESGCFQLFNTVAQSLVAIPPDNITYAQGSVLPLSLCTAAVMLFQDDTLALGLPRVDPVSNGKVVLAWGGASALGSNGIQMLKAAGYDVAAVAGSQNQQYCRDLGAEYVFDHRSTNVGNDILAALRGRDFAGVFCPIMSMETIAVCAQIAAQLGDNKGNRFVATSLAHAMPYQGELPEGVTIGYCWGDSLKHNKVGPAIWDHWLTVALTNGRFKCKPEPAVVGKGLECVKQHWIFRQREFRHGNWSSICLKVKCYDDKTPSPEVTQTMRFGLEFSKGADSGLTMAMLQIVSKDVTIYDFRTHMVD